MTNQPTIADTFAGPGEDALVGAAAEVARLGSCSSDYDALSDAAVLAGQKTLAQAQRELDTRKAWMAKTLAQRSRWELGQAGLAAQQGFLNPEALIQELTGSSKVESRKLVGVGRMLAEAEEAQAQADAADAEAARRLLDEALDPAVDPELDPELDPDAARGPVAPVLPPPPLPWHAPISHAVTTGALSIDAAHALRTGLGDIDTVVTAPVLADAVEQLLVDAASLNVDQLLKKARQTRDSLDAAGIRVREQKAWDDRYLRIWTLDTGQVRVDGLFPPEQGEFIKATFDGLTSPRRGGVRFVDADRAAWARRVRDDPRTTTQITCDGFLDLLRAGTTVNPNEMLGGRRPAVQILTTSAPAARPAAPAPPAAQAPPAVPAVPAVPAQPAAPALPGAPAEPVSPGGSAGPVPPVLPGGSDGPAGPVLPGGSAGPVPPVPPGGSAPPAATDTPTETDRPEARARPAGFGTPTETDRPDAGARPAASDDILTGPTGHARHGYLEGNTAPVSPETVERLICDAGSVEIRFDEHDRPLDVGREQRLFNRAQRRAMAARDGGCMWPGCDRPPAFTEAHHIEHWLRDHGRTDINQGILLCPAHHLLLHNQRWQIFENAGRYWLRPPATIDPGQCLIEMPSHNRQRPTSATTR